MTSCVLDASVTATLIFDDEKTAWSEAFFGHASDMTFVVPTLWFSEVGNLIRQGVRRNRIKASDAPRILDALLELPLETDQVADRETLQRALELASRHNLSFYDATYLELARRHGLPLASLDGDLVSAANAEGLKRLP